MVSTSNDPLLPRSWCSPRSGDLRAVAASLRERFRNPKAVNDELGFPCRTTGMAAETASRALVWCLASRESRHSSSRLARRVGRGRWRGKRRFPGPRRSSSKPDRPGRSRDSTNPRPGSRMQAGWSRSAQACPPEARFWKLVDPDIFDQRARSGPPSGKSADPSNVLATRAITGSVPFTIKSLATRIRRGSLERFD